MRNLLGTRLGHSCVEVMCQLLQNKNITEYSMLRGAVFFIGMGLWGTKCVQTLIHKPQSVLPSFKCALACRSPILAFEISLTCQRLVKKFGHELHVCAWDSILEIVELLFQNIESNPQSEQSVSLKQNAHELLTIIEKLYQTQAYNGSVDDLFQIIESHMKSRPNDSLLLLVAYRSQAINPAKSEWINSLIHFINVYFFSTIHAKVRLKVLELIETIVLNNMLIYEKELIENVIIPKFQKLSEESSVAVEEHALKFLLKLCYCSRSPRCISLLQILKPFVQLDLNLDGKNIKAVLETEIVLHGCAKIFIDKFHGELASHAVAAFEIMLSFIEKYYANPELHNHPNFFKDIRQKILKIFLEIRGDANHQLLLISKPDMCSGVVWTNTNSTASDCPKSPNSKISCSTAVVLPFQRVFSCFTECIIKEKFWPILEFTIDGVCGLLDDKCLILSLDREEIDSLTEALTGLISSSSRILTLSAAPPMFKRPQLMIYGLKVITVVISFHDYMTITRQRQVLRCLEAGFNSKSAKQCISATTLCVVEMKSEALLRNLPSILLRLSQLSATVALATAVLELLSTLAQLPQLYSNFVDDQYMSVFKIALQHADPEKFSLYVVSLAHHVINMWFIKCRLAFRPDFVRYITLSLKNMCRTPSSLQHNLIESCIDVMARYTFSNTMPVSKRPEKPKSTSKSGRSSTWLLGNRLITITTDLCISEPVPPNTSDPFSVTELSAELAEQSASGKKGSVEAPGKLQSSDEKPVRSTRHRHKSSGALLRQTSNDCDEPAVSFRATSEDSENNFAGSPWAEIFIRRPSGNNSWILHSHQLSLILHASSSTDSATSQSPSLSLSTSDLTKQDDVESSHGDFGDFTAENSWKKRDEAGISRQRSRTVSSSHDFVADAAARAKAKAREHSTRHQQSNLPKRTVPNKPMEKQLQLLSPEFIFLQFFQSAMVTDGLQRPLLLPNSATVERSVSVLDLIPPYDTWETGVVYVRPGQSSDGKAILYNQHGSVRYQNLLGSLGNLISLSDCDPSCTHLGGLDYAEGEDGDATYVWQENVMQMVFHIATLMPNLQSGVSNKQRHIGNDYVTIVYDDNDLDNYVPGSVVKGQFLSVEIIVNPLTVGYNIVTLVYHKSDLKDILQLGDKYTVSDERLGLLVRQLALHASMASAAHHHKSSEKFVSKPMSRLKQIKHIRSRALQEIAWKNEERAKRYQSSPTNLYSLEDFSDFVS